MLDFCFVMIFWIYFKILLPVWIWDGRAEGIVACTIPHRNTCLMQIHPISLGWLSASVHSMAWGNPVTAKKALCQLPWSHSAAALRPVHGFLCSPAQPQVTIKNSWHARSLLSFTSVLCQEDTVHFTWWATAGGAVLLKPPPTSTQHPLPTHPSVNICPVRPRAGAKHMGHTLAFMIQHEVTSLCPPPQSFWGYYGHFILHCIIYVWNKMMIEYNLQFQK